MQPQTTIPQLPMKREPHLDTLWHAALLCAICEEQPWAQHGMSHPVLLCVGCAEGEPNETEDA